MCAVYSLASAVEHAGDPASATTIAAWAAKSLKLATGTDRLQWVQTRCHKQLQPDWSARRLRDMQELSVAALLALLRAGDGIVTVLQIEDSEGDPRHCVGVCGEWLFDPNKPYAVPLGVSGLDECCLGGATFAKAHAGFQLVRGVGA